MNQVVEQTQKSLRRPLFLSEIVPQSFCEEVIQLFQSTGTRPRSYQGLVDYSVRRCNFLKLPESYDPQFQEIGSTHIEDYFEQKIDTQLRNRPMLYGYPVGVGFVPHHDQVTEIEKKRGETNGQPVVGGDYTLVMFCTPPDQYGGGELYFPELNWVYKPPPGSVVVYPTTVDYVHGVKPITHGVRYTIVCRYGVKH